MFKIEVNFNELGIKEWTSQMLIALDKGLNDTADLVAKVSNEKVKDKDTGSYDTGALAKSQIVNKDVKYSKEVGYTAPYSSFIEFGTRPHFPPVMRLYEWALRQRGKLGLKRGEIIHTKNDGFVYKDIWNFAWAISRHIAEEGSDPKPFFRPAIEEGRDKMNDLIKKRIKEVKWKDQYL